MGDLPELQQAVRALPGVREAVVRWPEPDAPAVLQVAFADGADEEAVSADVLATVERILGVDHDDLVVRRTTAAPEGAPPGPSGGIVGNGSPTGGAAGNGSSGRPATGAARPIFSGLRVDRRQLETSVDVTLVYEGQTAVGTADGLATHQHAALTAAAAALAAVRSFLPEDVRMQVEWVDIMEGAAPGRPTVVQVAVTCLRPGGEERLIGTAVARGDLRESAVRATLDALNRPLQRLAASA